MDRSILFLLSGALLSLALFLGGALAQDPPPTAPPAGGEEGAGGLPAEIVRERAYYVPFEKLEDVFERTGRGIFLPYEEFLELWEAARGKDPGDEEAGPPADAVIRGGLYRGAIHEDVARFEVRYEIESLKEGWSDVSLALGDVAVESVELSHPGAIFAARGKGYSVFLPEPGKHSLALTLSAPVKRDPGKKSLHFRIPRIAVSRLELTIPEEEIRVDVKPILAATQTVADEGSTRVLAFLGNAGKVTVSWMPPPGRAADGGAILFARQSVRAHLGERILKIFTDIDYEVLRGEVDTLRVRMPADTRLLSVKGDNLREWAPEGELLALQLHAPIERSYRLSLAFERILAETPAVLQVPFPRAEGVLRESGWAILGHEEGLKVRVTGAEGLSQLDPGEVPEALRGHLGVGYRYLAHPLSLTLAVEKITPVVRSHTVSVISLGRDEDHWIGWIDYEIARAGLFGLAFRVPSGWAVDSVGNPQQVEEFQTSDAGGRRTITVSLKSKAMGRFRLPFRLVREGSAAAGEQLLAAPEVLGSEQDRGLFGVSTPRALEVVTLERTNVLDADVDELFGTGIVGKMSSEGALPRTWRYRKQPARVRLRLEERKTEIEVLAQHLIEVADGEVRVTHILDYNILYAPVESLRFEAPSTLDETLKVEAKQKTQVRKVSSSEGRSLWEVSVQPPALGGTTLTITHTTDLQGLEPGTPFAYAVPIVHAAGARSEQGFVAVRKEGTLEIAPGAEGMEIIDAGDLPAKLRRGQIYSAFRYFSAAPSLELGLTRYDYEQLATTVVVLLRMQSILSEERRLKTQATFLVQNADRQYLELRLSPEARILSLTVADRLQSPKKRKQGAGTLIEIPRSAGAGGTFPVVLLYEEPIAGSPMGGFGFAGIRSPEVLEDVPVSKVELELYLPPEYAYMAWSGNLHRRHPEGAGLWSRFKGLVAGAGGVTGAGDMEVTRQLPPPGRWAGTAGMMEALTEGKKRFLFDTLAAAGRLSFFYSGWGLFWFIDFLAFAAAIAGSFLLLTRWAPSKKEAGAVLLFVTLTLTWFASGPAASFFLSLFIGSAIVCAAFIARDLGRRWGGYRAERRAERLALAPDPFIEEAPRAAPPPPPVPSSDRSPEPPPAPTQVVDREPGSEPKGPPPAATRKTKKKGRKKTTKTTRSSRKPPAGGK